MITSNVAVVGGSREAKEEGDCKVSSLVLDPATKTSTPKVQRNSQSSPFQSGHHRSAKRSVLLPLVNLTLSLACP